MTGKAAEQLGGLHGEAPAPTDWRHIHLVITSDNPYPYDSYDINRSFHVACDDVANEVFKVKARRRRIQGLCRRRGSDIPVRKSLQGRHARLCQSRVRWLGMWKITNMQKRIFKLLAERSVLPTVSHNGESMRIQALLAGHVRNESVPNSPNENVPNN